jgi:dTDP-glucose pyrophosphorylase
LCDAIFRAAPLIPDQEQVCIGLPDTVWFPRTALAGLPDDVFSLLLFPVEHPQRFDSVTTDDSGNVIAVQVKHPAPVSNHVWGAMKMPGSVLHQLRRLWADRGDEYLGTLLNEYMSRGGRVQGVKTGQAYVDVGTLGGYRDALRLIDKHTLTPSLP